MVEDESAKKAVTDFLADTNEYDFKFKNVSMHDTVDSTNSHFGHERFRIAQKLQKTSLVDYVIFLDENLETLRGKDAHEVSEVYDFKYEKGYIEQLWNSR